MVTAALHLNRKNTAGFRFGNNNSARRLTAAGLGVLAEAQPKGNDVIHSVAAKYANIGEISLSRLQSVNAAEVFEEGSQRAGQLRTNCSLRTCVARFVSDSGVSS